MTVKQVTNEMSLNELTYWAAWFEYVAEQQKFYGNR